MIKLHITIIHRSKTLQWRHNERGSVSNHQSLKCLLNCRFRRRSKKTSKIRVTGFCVGNSPVTGEFPAQKTSNAENVSIWWRHRIYEIVTLSLHTQFLIWNVPTDKTARKCCGIHMNCLQGAYSAMAFDIRMQKWIHVPFVSEFNIYVIPGGHWGCLSPALKSTNHDDAIHWKHFPRYWPFVQGIQRSPVNSPHKGHWRGALTFSLICAWINVWVNNREAGDLRRHRAHYDVIVMNHQGVGKE